MKDLLLNVVVQPLIDDFKALPVSWKLMILGAIMVPIALAATVYLHHWISSRSLKLKKDRLEWLRQSLAESQDPGDRALRQEIDCRVAYEYPFSADEIAFARSCASPSLTLHDIRHGQPRTLHPSTCPVCPVSQRTRNTRSTLPPTHPLSQGKHHGFVRFRFRRRARSRWSRPSRRQPQQHQLDGPGHQFAEQ